MRVIFILLIGFHLTIPRLGVAQDIPSFETLKANHFSSEATLFDRYGDILQKQRVSHQKRSLPWVSLSDVSPTFLRAVVLSEDRRFYEHGGMDWLSAAHALKNRIFTGKSGGASTITMQVAALIDSSLKPKKINRTFRQKIDQALLAMKIEKNWTKREILEFYINSISYRGELFGIASASKGLFSKDPIGLNQDESLILAALIRSPEAAEEKVVNRACELGLAWQPPILDCTSLRLLVARNGLRIQGIFDTKPVAPHLARLALKQGKTQTTINARIQSRVLHILRQQVLSLKSRNMNDAAAVVLDNQTGEVLSYVGSVGDLSEASDVDGVRALRQAGSTLKPFLYALALQKKYLVASSLLDDSQTDISLGQGVVYRPRDFDHEYHGKDVTLRQALGSSLNLPAVRTLGLVGVNSLIKAMDQLGFTQLQSEEYYGPSLALGTADVSLWELVNAYRTLANGGIWSEASFTLEPTRLKRNKHRVFSSEVSFIISDILSDSTSRSLTFGLSSPLSLKTWAAVKTGTSKDMRDNWCVGYSHDYTVGVWAGNFSGKPMWNVSGISGAAPAWAEIMTYLGQSQPRRSIHPPQGLVKANGEWYLKGTEPLNNEVNKNILIPKISYPAEGLTVAWDPDIPQNNQKIHFEAKNIDPHQTEKLYWQLNDKPLGSADQAFVWQIQSSGSYELKLVEKSGHTVDQVHFTVSR